MDFDLAVRHAGFKVMYQPESRLTHYWGTTVNSKGDAPDSPRRQFQRNYARLMGKWFDELGKGVVPVPGRASARSGSVKSDDRLHVLFTLFNFRFLTGSELYVYELCRELREPRPSGHGGVADWRSGRRTGASAGRGCLRHPRQRLSPATPGHSARRLPSTSLPSSR